MRFVAVLLCLAAFSTMVSAVPINIHIRLSDEARQTVEALSARMRAALPNDEIDFQTQFIPHVTLYLTDFQPTYIKEVILSSSSIVANYVPCLMTTSNWVVSGDYGMWNVNTSSCLQQLSNQIVEATHQFITPNQTIPGWVLSLPEPLRSEKIALIQKYGSPNVFEQFQPHVTMLWDHQDTNVVSETEFMHQIPPLSWFPPLLGLAHVGPYGTVLKGPEFSVFDLTTNHA
eukprot:TRINITY_DN6606_c0_g1_i1.p1 TRINITY_DN6606_c0_g1~~TRINITY_DN6606_c0_g1_i1.p1  ORF type:complete len:230 (+),score=13.38 TRINITY_DN6606_c0_g1_i1:52-741(+)